MDPNASATEGATGDATEDATEVKAKTEASDTVRYLALSGIYGLPLSR